MVACALCTGATEAYAQPLFLWSLPWDEIRDKRHEKRRACTATVGPVHTSFFLSVRARFSARSAEAEAAVLSAGWICECTYAHTRVRGLLLEAQIASCLLLPSCNERFASQHWGLIIARHDPGMIFPFALRTSPRP